MLPEKDNTHSWNGGRWGVSQVVSLKDEVDIGTKFDALARRHG